MRTLGRLTNLTTDIGDEFPPGNDGELFTLLGNTEKIDGLYLYVNNQWRIVGELAVGEVIQTESVNGQSLIMLKDPSRGNKQLSIDYVKYIYGHDKIKNNTWLGTSVSLGANAGYMMPLDGTIVMTTVQVQDPKNESSAFDLYINGSLSQEIISLPASINPTFDSEITLNIDFSANDIVQVRSRMTSGDSSDCILSLFVKWRKA